MAQRIKGRQRRRDLTARCVLFYVLPMGNGLITLGDMRAKGMSMLAVACSKCERRGRLRIARLIAEHGAGECDLRRLVAHDCPRMRDPSVSIYERCGVHFPELPKWFGTP